MNRGERISSPAGGFTIVETLIFLAVSAAIFFSTMLLIGGRQNREYFNTAVKDFESRLLDIANDISTGYYQTTGSSLTCQNGAGGPVFPGGSQPIGTNDDCILVGTVVKFGDGGNQENLVRLTMAGLRQVGGSNTTNLASAQPKAINNPGTYSSVPIGAGVTVQCVGIGATTCNPSSTDNRAIGFFTTFDGSSITAQSGGVIRANVLNFPAVDADDSISDSINKLNAVSYPANPTLNPGIVICLNSGTTSQYALVRLGSSNGGSNLTTTSEIKNYTGATPPCN